MATWTNKVTYVCISLVAGLNLFYFINADVISSLILKEFEQKDCLTKCETGLLANVDHLILGGQIKLKDSFQLVGIMVSLQWKANRESEPNDLYILYLDNNCNGFELNVNFYCEKTSDDRTFNLHLNMTAETKLSEVFMVLAINNEQFEYTSNEVRLPKIYSTTNAALTINGNDFTGDCSTINYVSQLPRILRLCCHGTPSPCDVKIHHVGVHQVMGEECVDYIQSQEDRAHLNFSYTLCNLPQLSKSYVCHIGQANNVISSESNSVFNIIIFVAVGITVIIVLGMIALCCWKTRGQSQHEFVLESAKTKQS